VKRGTQNRYSEEKFSVLIFGVAKGGFGEAPAMAKRPAWRANYRLLLAYNAARSSFASARAGDGDALAISSALSVR